MSSRAPSETPLMRQYFEVKERYPDCVVFFRVGDFYELFGDDAVRVARAIDLTLTTRDKGREDAVPMCGVPYHAAKVYVARLVEQGFKVAVCDQVEDPRLARGLVKREVTRVVTPGVLLDEDQLDARAGCYLAALAGGGAPLHQARGEAPRGPTRFGLAWLDVSTGEFGATELLEVELADELVRIAPRELLLPPSVARERLGTVRAALSAIAEDDPAADTALVEEALGTSVAELGLGALPRALAAAAAAIRYARATQPGGALPIARLVVQRPADHLVLDEATQSNLELFETIAERRRKGSLLGVLDDTRTAPGARLLRRWLGAPLVEVAGIRRRHDAVEWLVERATLRATVREQLDGVYDLERLAGRVILGVATPRDLVALRRSLERLPTLGAALAGAAGHDLAAPDLLQIGIAEDDDPRSRAPRAVGPGSPELAPGEGGRERPAPIDLGEDVAADIQRTLVDDPPAQWKEGGIIRRGCSADLDELHDIETGGKDAILAMEARERERTGIASLKIRFNRVFGFYIEITRSNLARVPDGYQRKQTLANAERFVTEELAEYERKVLGAEERKLALEEELFVALRGRVAAQARRLQALAGQVAHCDALSSLAEVAHRGGYCRPEIDGGPRYEIEDGRHPVVEQLVAAGTFVPNDVRVSSEGPDDAQMLVITGPNMAGKSTVMRQVALTAVMAQAGSFVPARRARLGVVDRVFTRVGASDNLSRGESTFMVEMRETAAILRHATRRSLVILDEIGRGTSTYDGLSIAWAVAEFLHDRVGCKTLFATHYHELTTLERSRPRVRNFQVAVREWPASTRAAQAPHSSDDNPRHAESEVVFLHKLVEGGASRSYGIQVARLAGLPRTVLERAREVLRSLESGEEGGPGRGSLARSPQLSLFAAAPASDAAPAPPPALPPEERSVLEALRAVDVDDLSPRQALSLLADWKARLLS